MKCKNYRCFLITLIIFLSSCTENTFQNTTVNKLEPAQNWFDAWDLINNDLLSIDSLAPVDFVFFDDSLVYSTSRITVADGEECEGPQLKNLNLAWRVIKHNGKIMLPDGQEVQPGVMSFAAPVDSSNSKSFFVMPLPGYWQKAGVKSDELGLGNLLTGIFLHEFFTFTADEKFRKTTFNSGT